MICPAFVCCINATEKQSSGIHHSCAIEQKWNLFTYLICICICVCILVLCVYLYDLYLYLCVYFGFVCVFVFLWAFVSAFVFVLVMDKCNGEGETIKLYPGPTIHCAPDQKCICISFVFVFVCVLVFVFVCWFCINFMEKQSSYIQGRSFLVNLSKGGIGIFI